MALRTQFVNREDELKTLNEALDTSSPALFVLYGRRRVGKTALLRQTCRKRKAVFFTADLGSRTDQLSSFANALARGLGESEWAGVSFPGWEQALRVCLERSKRQRMVLILDEFQYLVTADRSLPSTIQRLWDTEISDSQLSIVLCGSYVSFMERRALGVRNPLFGRRTGQLALAPLRFRDAGRFLPRWAAVKRMEAVGTMGCVPAYLRLLEPSLTLEDNVRKTVLEMGAPLLDEPRFLMMEELREPRVHFSICRAMAHGHGRPNEIAQAAGLTGKGNIASYLSSLRELRFVERRVPATVRNPERSRLGRYRLSDPFLRFWFRFVLPNRSTLEAGDASGLWKTKIQPHLAQHVSVAFEDACREFLSERNRRGKLPAMYDRIGSWWRHENEVDVVAVADEGAILLGECKWTAKPAGLEVLAKLTAKTAAVQADLKRPARKVHLAIFSRAGFTKELIREAKKLSVLLVDVEQVLKSAR